MRAPIFDHANDEIRVSEALQYRVPSDDGARSPGDSRGERGRVACRIHSIGVIDGRIVAVASEWMLPGPDAAAAYSRRYEPRSTQAGLLYRIVDAELDGFLESARERGHPLPRFVETTLRDFLTCGVPEHGFVRVHCDACGRDRVVPFSCKRRGPCSSCAGRRMAETAAHLVDRVLSQVPIRQWVLTLPFSLRYRLAYDRRMLTPVLAAFMRSVFASHKRRAREELGIYRAKCGAVSFVQRFGGALNLNVHFHSLVLEGVYEVRVGQHLEGVYEVLPNSRGLRFARLPAPDTPEVLRVLADAVERTAAALGRCGFGQNHDDELARNNPPLAALYAAAVEGRNATGADAGRRVTRIGRPTAAAEPDESLPSRCAVLGGFSLHAGVFMPATDRSGLERLCRYMGRPALAVERLEQLGDGRILYRLRHRWRDGTSAIVFAPSELLARLAAQIPPPNAHQVRYHGVLAPAAAWRPYVVPAGASSGDDAGPQRGSAQPNVPPWKRIAWSELLRRVFAVDALVCDRCGGRMRLMATIRSPQEVAKFLASAAGGGRPPPASSPVDTPA